MTRRKNKGGKGKRSKAAMVCMALGILMLCAAVGLLLYNRKEAGDAGNAAAKIFSRLLDEIGRESEEEPEGGTAGPQTGEETAKGRAQDGFAQGENGKAEENGQGAKKTGTGGEAVLEIDGNGYIGYLTIPALDLELPVMSEWSYPSLRIAPCRYYGSPLTDNLVICGHNYTQHFGRLDALQKGDEVRFTTVNGLVTVYEVEEIEILEPAAVQEMIDSGYDLTLYTCTYGGASRITVRCDRREEKKAF